MRLFLLAALACAVIALICAVSPTTIAGVGAIGWLSASAVAYLSDLLFGGVLPIVGGK